jgi:Mn2+/Fe2+ NRAMP family transporter
MQIKQTKNQSLSFLRALGPGLLFAAVAVGISHLVQSTRAGALYGVGMLVFIILAMAVKYPFYRFGPQYTAATGLSLIDAFRREGLLVFSLFSLLLVITAFIAIAALSSGTAAIAGNAFNISVDATELAIALLICNSFILIIGRYHWLDILMKLLIIVLSISTVAATILTIPLIDFKQSITLMPTEIDKTVIIFVVSLVGWMPAPLEAAVGHSLWTKAKTSDSGYRPSIKESILDFHVGYAGSFLLAVCFMLLGAGVMQNSSNELAPGVAQFTDQLIGLYESALGDWSGSLVRVSAFAVMYSTMLAVTDSYSRMISGLVLQLRTPERPWEYDFTKLSRVLFITIVIILSAGGLLVLLTLAESFRVMFVIATSIAFLSAPFIAILIYRAMTQSDLDDSAKPGLALRRYSIFCIGGISLFAAAYLLLLIW